MVWYGMVWYGMVWYGVVWCSMVWYGTVRYGICQSVYYKLTNYFTLFSTLYEHTILSYETSYSAFKIILLFHLTSFVIRRTITRVQRLHSYAEQLAVSCHLHKLLETTCRKPVTNSEYASRFLTTFNRLVVNKLSQARRTYLATECSKPWNTRSPL